MQKVVLRGTSGPADPRAVARAQALETLWKAVAINPDVLVHLAKVLVAEDSLQAALAGLRDAMRGVWTQTGCERDVVNAKDGQPGAPSRPAASGLKRTPNGDRGASVAEAGGEDDGGAGCGGSATRKRGRGDGSPAGRDRNTDAAALREHTNAMPSPMPVHTPMGLPPAPPRVPPCTGSRDVVAHFDNYARLHMAQNGVVYADIHHLGCGHARESEGQCT